MWWGTFRFPDKGFGECRGVVAASCCSFLALCLVCSTFTVDEHPLGAHPALWPCSVEYPFLWNIPVGEVTVFQLDVSRTVVVIPRFLVFQARWNNVKSR